MEKFLVDSPLWDNSLFRAASSKVMKGVKVIPSALPVGLAQAFIAPASPNSLPPTPSPPLPSFTFPPPFPSTDVDPRSMS